MVIIYKGDITVNYCATINVGINRHCELLLITISYCT